jgi:hypothetical protein
MLAYPRAIVCLKQLEECACFQRSRAESPLDTLCALTRPRIPLSRTGCPFPNSWKWEIYRAAKSSPVGQSPVYFQTMPAAGKAGQAALKQLLGELNS